MKQLSNIIFFVITDLHLGLTNKTPKLLSNLIDYFNHNKKTISKSDVLVLDGDTFDKLLTPNSTEYKLAIIFIAYIVKFCKAHNVKLRILEGTPSHDNKQMEAISELITREYGDSYIDYKYIQTLQIEYMKEYDKYILYLPDKTKESGVEIEDSITQLLSDAGLSKVDLVFAHGNFKYQLPITLKSELSEDFFLDICRYYIVIGHIHVRSIFKRIIAPGSFDRMEVNNEGPKGGVMLHIGKSIDSSTFEFIDNNNAMRYDTLRFLGLSSKDIYKKVKRHIEVNNFNQYDHLRLETDSREIFTEVKKRLQEDDNTFRVERYDPDTKTSKNNKAKDIKKVLSESFEINRENVYTLLLGRTKVSILPDNDKYRLQKLLELCS